MNKFKGKVAVVTGAASGIGRAIALHCAQEKMNVVLADVEEGALARVEEELKKNGASVLAVVTDVSRFDDVVALAQQTRGTFGAVHLLFSNAGIVLPWGSVWESSCNDWK